MTVSDRSTDAELIELARSGELAAFGRLVDRYQRDAVRIAAVALGSAVEADDVAQEAFVKAHASLPRFDVRRPFRPWLYRIITNTARNHNRGSGRRAALEVRSARRSVDVIIGPEEIAVHRDDMADLVEAMNRLSESDRLILTCRWLDEMSEEEIAEVMGCRRGTVKSRLNRAMKRLRREVGAE